MTMQGDTAFSGSVPQLYERHMVPMIFAPYAEDLAARAAALRPMRVLELAAGTGVLTRRLAPLLPPSAAIIATDLNPGMLEEAARLGTPPSVTWRQADAQQLPFEDGSFDLVLGQFGAMFFPDKPGAYAEARRVLAPGGTFLFSTWEGLPTNDFATVVVSAMEALFPNDPPRFIARVPHGYHDPELIARHLAEGGFTAAPDIVSVPALSRAPSAHIAATAFCQGTPLRGEIEMRRPGGLLEATAAVEAELTHRYGSGPIQGRMGALVVRVGK